MFLTRRQSQLTTLVSEVLLDHLVSSGASQYLLWDGYNASEKLLAEPVVFLTRISCAIPDNENDFAKPVKL